MKLDARTKIKVTKFYRSETIIVDTENIFWLEVAMCNTLGVKKLQGRGHISDYISCLLLSEKFPPLDVVQKLATRNLLKDEVKSVGLLKVLDKLDDVLVALTMVEEVNLLEDPGPAMARHLVNDLDRVLHLRVDVDTRLHRGISTLAKNLPG